MWLYYTCWEHPKNVQHWLVILSIFLRNQNRIFFANQHDTLIRRLTDEKEDLRFLVMTSTTKTRLPKQDNYAHSANTFRQYGNSLLNFGVKNRTDSIMTMLSNRGTASSTDDLTIAVNSEGHHDSHISLILYLIFYRYFHVFIWICLYFFTFCNSK